MRQKKQNSTNTLNEHFLEERCTLNKVLKIIGKRWITEILILIEKDVYRFSQLKECLSGISDNVLSTALNELVERKLIRKEIYNQVPLKVEYQITDTGLEMLTVLHSLCAWGKKHIPYDVRMTPGVAKKAGI
ncbi:winged helix-turn-helix transcriptional regulator [Chitinophaga arvensicola]|uniref:DNA-binding transcriptional regulator, HxlR family n=1 Tax=Chitinophaga arvensicola TaxID=29529 RepID=A0A1I0RBE5_9BACT|nr:helix-turn-helix domain-containing protein [Chitinophaga arvensicola]SEW37915.1 DNA-binding transcriptional regulator, HxlR family [Chitinophaga arvensicola]